MAATTNREVPRRSLMRTRPMNRSEIKHAIREMISERLYGRLLAEVMTTALTLGRISPDEEE
jgi:hypothetical protein